MSSDKYFDYKEKQIFTDITLIINGISIFAHKLILCTSCQYFERMLLGSMKESKQNEIVINAVDTNAMVDVINKLYGQDTNVGYLPSWEHELKKIICMDYLGLPFSLDVIENMVIPEEGLELLFMVANVLNYNDQIKNIISRNLPSDYVIPNNLIAMMSGYSQKYNLAVFSVYDDRSRINILEIENNNVNKLCQKKYR